MNGSNSLMSLFVGFLSVFTIISIIRLIRLYYYYRASFYPVVYSGFFEFAIRNKNLKRLSHSYWLENELGYHRIMYQVTKNEENIQPYILLLLSTGLYVIQIYNESAEYIYNEKNFRKIVLSNENKKIVKFLPYPLILFNEFHSHFSKLTGQSIKTIDIMAFTDSSVFQISDKNIIAVSKKDLIETIKNIHQKKSSYLSNEEIDIIFNKVLHYNNQ